MKLWLIRHADPDYSVDSLTDTGWAEAAALADYLEKQPIKEFYVSPLGRAKATAAVTLQRIGREAEELPWLREFPARPDLTGRDELQEAYPDQTRRGDRLYADVIWDMLPEYLADHPEYLDREGWRTAEAAIAAGMPQQYDAVTAELDALLARHGYRRQGLYYAVDRANRDTLAFFCHFGLECVLLSHLLNVSPFVLWQGMAAAPSAVTVVNTEERRAGTASFRMARFGDISHLYAAGRSPSFSARFCETYDSTEERH